jgi:hypothetical protein
MTSSPASAAWTLVPAGWQSSEPGYWGDEATGRDTLEALRTYREERDAWKQAFESVRDENQIFQEKMEQRFSGLEESLEKERAAWKREIRKAKGPGFGIFAGYGFDSHGDGNFVIGAGIVWKIF